MHISLFIFDGQKICQACWQTLQALSGDDATPSSTLSSTESEADASTHSARDAATMITLFELCSVSPLKQHGKSKQTQAVEARRRILKTAKIVLTKASQESRSVKVCDEQNDHITKEDKEKIEHSIDFAKPLV